jgi:hypothetical protein
MYAAIRRTAGLAVALLCLLPAAAWAAPANDNYFDPPNAAFHLAAGTGEFDTAATGGTAPATTYTNEPMSTTDDTESRCAENGQLTQGTGVGSRITKTVWWSFTGTGGPVTVSSYFSNFDTVLAVWTLENDGFHFVRCNDDVDVPNGDLSSELVFTSTANETYYVQVGGCNACTFDGDPTPDSGSLGLYVYPPPANDRRTGAQTVNPGQNVPRDTLGAQADAGETQSCGGRAYGKTVWYRFVVPKTGTATIDASGFDSAVALYAGSSTAPLGCRVGPADGATSLSRHLGPGTYFAQVGGQGAGFAAARGDLNTRVTFVADPDPGGGTTTPPPTTPPVITTPKVTKVSSSYDYEGVWGATSKFTALDVLRAPAGSKIVVTCKGKGCRKKRIVKRVRRAQRRVPLAKLMRRNGRLRPKTVVEIRVTAPGKIGKVFRFRIRPFNRPARTTRCLRPGAKRTTAC